MRFGGLGFALAAALLHAWRIGLGRLCRLLEAPSDLVPRGLGAATPCPGLALA